MRAYIFKFSVVLLLGISAQFSVNAQDVNGGVYQSAEEQQRIKEMRLLEWYAQQQQFDAGQGNAQNASFNESYKPEPAAAPEREDLFNAASSGNINLIRELLSQGLNINVSNNERETALHMAAARGHFETVRFLVNNGAHINAFTVKRWIPLHHAVRFRHANIVNFLIQRGSPAHARTSDGMSAIDMADNNQDYRILAIMGAR